MVEQDFTKLLKELAATVVASFWLQQVRARIQQRKELPGSSSSKRNPSTR